MEKWAFLTVKDSVHRPERERTSRVTPTYPTLTNQGSSKFILEEYLLTLRVSVCQFEAVKQVTCHFYTTGLTWEGTILTIMLCNRTKFPCPCFSLVFSLLYFVDDGHSPSLPAENHVTHPESHVLPQKIFRHSPISWQ